MSAATNKIFSLIPKIISEIGHVGKDRKSTQDYKYRGIDDALAVLQPLLAKHGVFFTTKVLKAEREERQSRNGSTMIYSVLDIETRFFADDGSSVDCITRGEAMDSGDKASNKCMSVALKYAIWQTFCVPTFGAEDDTEHGEQPQVMPKTTRVVASQPGPNDGYAKDVGYRIDFGKWNRKSLEEVAKNEGPDEIANYIDYIHTQSEKKNQPIQGAAAMFIQEATAFLKAFESSQSA